MVRSGAADGMPAKRRAIKTKDGATGVIGGGADKADFEQRIGDLRKGPVARGPCVPGEGNGEAAAGCFSYSPLAAFQSLANWDNWSSEMSRNLGNISRSSSLMCCSTFSRRTIISAK
jgi:hypothetical protein